MPPPLRLASLSFCTPINETGPGWYTKRLSRRKGPEMNRPRRLAIALLFVTSAAFAQTPPAPKTQAAAPAQSTYTIPIGNSIGLDAAKKAAAAASAEARKNGWFMAIAVVDPA